MKVKSEASWWVALKKRDMLEMALVLSKHALPAWSNYNFPVNVKAKVRSLPKNALSEIESFLLQKDDNDHHLNHIYTAFITPVVQLQDADLIFPYEVRSAFLSVFQLVRGIISKNNFISRQSFSTSISRSLDAIRIGNIMTDHELSELTSKYLLLCNLH